MMKDEYNSLVTDPVGYQKIHANFNHCFEGDVTYATLTNQKINIIRSTQNVYYSDHM